MSQLPNRWLLHPRCQTRWWRQGLASQSCWTSLDARTLRNKRRDVLPMNCTRFISAVPQFQSQPKLPMKFYWTLRRGPWGGNTVTFCNTHSIFADIIWAEIFEPNLSNSIPTLHTSLHSSARFRLFRHSSDPSVCIPCAILQPCLQILRSITLALIVSNCLSFSCSIMIRDIAPHAPSICSFWVLSLFFMHPWLYSIEYLSSPCHVYFRILNIELDPTLIHLALLDSSDKLIQSCAFRAPPNYMNSEPPFLSPSHSYSESFRYTTPFQCVPETQFVTPIRNTLDATEGRCSIRAEANPRKPLNFRTSGLDFWRIRVAWATHNKLRLGL